MSQAIFGLLGVVVGAVVAGGVDFVLERRRESRTLLRARRLLTLELIEAQSLIESSLREGRWLAEPTRVLSNELWMEHQGVWAAADDKPWKVVSDAFLRIADVRRHHSEAANGTPIESTPRSSETIDRALTAIHLALDELSVPDP